MKKIALLLATIIFISLLVLKIFEWPPLGWKGNLINPMGRKDMFFNTKPTPVASPNAPKTFNFDSSTDLKQELEKVNPQVLDSDFE